MPTTLMTARMMEVLVAKYVISPLNTVLLASRKGSVRRETPEVEILTAHQVHAVVPPLITKAPPHPVLAPNAVHLTNMKTVVTQTEEMKMNEKRKRRPHNAVLRRRRRRSIRKGQFHSPRFCTVQLNLIS